MRQGSIPYNLKNDNLLKKFKKHPLRWIVLISGGIYEEEDGVMRRISMCVFILLISIPAFGEKARDGLFFDQSFAVSVQPSGAQSATKLFRRFPLYEKTGVLWDAAKVDVGLDNRLTPSYEVPFLFIDVIPIAFFDIRLRAGYMQFYRGLGYGFTRLGSYDAEWSASKRSGVHRGNRGGLWLDASPSLRLALGPFAFVNTFTVTRVDFGSHGYFYEPYQDVALRCSDHTFMNDTIAVWRYGGFAAGINHFILHVPGSGYSSESASAVAAWSAKPGGDAEWYAGVKAGMYLRNRYYRGEFVAAAWIGASLRLR